MPQNGLRLKFLRERHQKSRCKRIARGYYQYGQKATVILTNVRVQAELVL